MSLPETSLALVTVGWWSRPIGASESRERARMAKMGEHYAEHLLRLFAMVRQRELGRIAAAGLVALEGGGTALRYDARSRHTTYTIQVPTVKWPEHLGPAPVGLRVPEGTLVIQVMPPRGGTDA